MSREMLKSLIDLIDDKKDIETLYQVVLRFIPEDKALPDEIEAILQANQSIRENGTVSYDTIEKGYKLCVQPARVDRYTDDEFRKMLKMFSELNPYAIYIVDSWGTQNNEQILHYVSIADEILDNEVAIGYHGHNNMMQAFGNAVEFTRKQYERDIIVDASIYGIGRGAGNLNTEIFAKYMNEQYHKEYDITPMIRLYELYIKDIYEQHMWGYCIPYFLTAKYNCNPNYGEYYGLVKKLSATDIENILKMIPAEDRVLYSKKKAEDYLNEYSKHAAFGGRDE